MAMTNGIQQQFMYLFERVGEPLYFGPRGQNNTIYNVPVNNLDSKTQHAASEYRKNWGNMGNSIPVKAPSQIPNLANIGSACPKSTLFSYFIPAHRAAASELRQVFMGQRSRDDFFSMACLCRDSESINPRLWIHAFATSCLLRPDLRGFRLPAIWEIEPDQYVGPNVVRMAQRQAVLPQQDRSVIVVDRNFTGDDSNPENLLSYFREDLGVNSHHWHWHIVYPLDSPPNQRNRKGELFYWMHHDMVARYDAERLSNGLSRVRRHDLTEVIPEGYFPKLYDTNSGIIWGSRQENSLARSVDRAADRRFPVRLDFEDMITWKTRINEAIDTGAVLRSDGQMERLSVERGIDILGDILEASDLSPNKQLYGDYHNMGHVSIAFCHDPMFRHRENMGTIGDSNTAMRDPIFYRWHKHIDEIFDKYKSTLPPYTNNDLVWSGVRVSEFSVQTTGREINSLTTNWMQSDIDLARGLDFGRTNINNLGPIWARVTHLNHETFTYTINIENSGRENLTGTVRIFMAPRLNENRARFDYAQQRTLFFNMDKFTTVLRPGSNRVTRLSSASSAAIPWEQSFRDLERSVELPSAAQSVCGCGWPLHLLLPKGTPSGMLYDLYVIVTNSAVDTPPRRNNAGGETRGGCRDAVSYCGLLDELYPDTKAMGYPFDRHAPVVGGRPIGNLDAFVSNVPNSRAVQVRIFHRNVTTVRPGGAPSTMTVMPGSTPASPSTSPSPSRPSTPPPTLRPSTPPPTLRPSTPPPFVPSSPTQTRPPNASGNLRGGSSSPPPTSNSPLQNAWWNKNQTPSNGGRWGTNNSNRNWPQGGWGK